MKGMEKAFVVAAVLSLFLVVLPMTAGASMVAEKNIDGLYLFLDIPFDATTPEDFQSVVQKRTGMEMTINPVEDSQIVTSTARQGYEMDLFGYPATLAATFHKNAELRYIKLYSRLASLLPEYENGIKDHGALGLKVYQEMREKAVQQYGEPDKEYFITRGDGIGFWKQGDEWDSAEMVKIFETVKSNVSIFTHWGNVRLFSLMYFNKRGPAMVEFCYANREWPVPKTIRDYGFTK